jgi:hypothetical protein
VFEPDCFVGDLFVVEDEAGCRILLTMVLDYFKWINLLFQTLCEKHEARPRVGIS